MQHIEFLPARYRQRRVARRSVLRRLVVVAVMVGLLASASAWQHRQQRAAREELAKAEALYAAAQANTQRLTELRNELQRAGAVAELCVFLNRPWPRSQALAAVAEALPSEIELEELHLTQETIESAGDSRSSAPARGRPASREPTDAPPAVLDLKRLREEFDPKQTVLHISGVAYEPAAVHRFVADLGLHPLFSRAELGSFETVDHPQRGKATQFTARVVMRPEYGHPLGPRGPYVALDAEKAVQ